MSEFAKKTPEKIETKKEQLSVPQTLIDRYWRSRHPDFHDPADTTINEELFFALAEAHGLKRTSFIGRGQWGTYRYCPDENDRERYVDLGFDVDELIAMNEDYKSPHIRIPIRVQSAIPPYNQKFWAGTYELTADQAMISASQNAQAKRWREEERIAEQAYREYIKGVELIPATLYGQGWIKGDAEPSVQAFLLEQYPKFTLSDLCIRLRRDGDSGSLVVEIAEGTERNILDYREVVLED